MAEDRKLSDREFKEGVEDARRYLEAFDVYGHHFSCCQLILEAVGRAKEGKIK